MSCFEDCYPEIWEDMQRKQKPWNYDNRENLDADDQAIIEHEQDYLINPQNYETE